MATEKAQVAPDIGRTAEERCAYVLLHAPGCTGKEGEPVAGGAWLQEQARVVARAVPGLGVDLGGSGAGELGPAMAAAIGRGAAGGLVSTDGGRMSLTPRGRRAAAALWEAAGAEAREAAGRAKRLLNDMGYWELVAFACTAPAGAEAGPGIAEELGRRRLDAAASLAGRHKVSVSKAAEIAGMDTEDFEAELMKRGIAPYPLSWERYSESMRLIDRVT